MFFFHHVRNFYGRFERPISSLSLVAGFVFDILTLKRVDTLWENFWILGHLLIVGFFIILIHAQESSIGDETNPSKRHFWYINILQFFFGGILSTYLVFYFRSADIFVAWPFIALLVGAFWANESLKRHYVRLSFQISLFFLSIYSFAIFLLPVVMHHLGPWIFILSGIFSIVCISLFMMVLFRFSRDKFEKSSNVIIFSIGSIFLIVNFLYFTNLIPPIPLSLKDAGVYHSVVKDDNGDYDVSYEDQGWTGYFKFYPTFSMTEDSLIYIYSAVFSPNGLNLQIVHEWQYYDTDHTRWVTDSSITLPVLGGRDNGFRTYSVRSNLKAGRWRVNIKTSSGQTMGHVRFFIKPVLFLPLLQDSVKY